MTTDPQMGPDQYPPPPAGHGPTFHAPPGPAQYPAPPWAPGPAQYPAPPTGQGHTFHAPPTNYPPHGPGYPGQFIAAGPGRAPTNSMATTSLWLGIAAMFCLGALTGVPAVVTGVMAKKKIRESAGAETGDTQALWGIILGSIATALSIAWLLLMVITSIAAAGSPDSVIRTDSY